MGATARLAVTQQQASLRCDCCGVAVHGEEDNQERFEED